MLGFFLVSLLNSIQTGMTVREQLSLTALLLTWALLHRNENLYIWAAFSVQKENTADQEPLQNDMNKIKAAPKPQWLWTDIRPRVQV